MKARAAAGTWDAVLERMLRELRGNEPRADAYWAQQLALGPVLFHALALRLRADGASETDTPHLARVLRLADAVLGPLPELGVDPAALAILARRQAAALATGRRRQIARLSARHGLGSGAPATEAVPPRLVRPYPLLGWLPPDEQISRALARGEREIAAGDGVDLDDVLRQADALLDENGR